MAVASSIQPISNLEIYTLIWLDSSANGSQETIQAQKHFRTAINYLKVFKHSDECIDYIKFIPNDDRVVLIVSGRLGQETVPQIHQYRKVSAIYVYCMDKKKNEHWANQFNKVRIAYE